MTNRKTNATNHNAADIAPLLAAFRKARAKLVDRFEQLHESDWDESALYPRLKQPTRIADIAFFDPEHDDYHVARIGDLTRLIGQKK